MKVCISIPKETYEKVIQIEKEGEFPSFSATATFILNHYVSDEVKA